MKYLRWIGLALSLLGIGFVVVQLGAYAGDLGEFRPSLLQAVLLMVLALVYGAANVALAVAWRDLLEHCGAPSDVRWAVQVFGVTQLAKYIPGNFFHLASRQTVGMSDGHEAMPLLKSAVWEFAAIMSSAAVFGLWLGPLLQPVVAESDLLVAIVLNRAITAGGDTLFYAFAAALGNRQ
ncbi:MAG TPA: hypothetical protein VLT59_06165 [Steroidobacteraceae bacterium]|nr:hypothetical protein [Steroidobacteraceae bacterium]